MVDEGGAGNAEVLEDESLGLRDMAVHLGISEVEGMDVGTASGSAAISFFFFNSMGISPGSYSSPSPAAAVFLLSLNERLSSGGASAGRFVLVS
jgi:hypothetical protein